MTKDQILKKAIKKVGGWLGDNLVSVSFDEEGMSIDSKDKNGTLYDQRVEYSDKGYYGLIFSHEFAKAFWPNEPTYELACPKCDRRYIIWHDEHPEYGPDASYCCDDGRKLKKVVKDMGEVWGWHLANMVKYEEPLKYLNKFL